jgi:hypothetical protein
MLSASSSYKLQTNKGIRNNTFILADNTISTCYALLGLYKGLFKGFKKLFKGFKKLFKGLFKKLF